MKKITIGKNQENDLVLNGRYISDFHAEIIEKQDDFYISDLTSTFGTFVNGKKLGSEHFSLKKGDKVKISTQLIDWKSEFAEEEKQKNPIYLKDLFFWSGKVEKSDYKIAVLILVCFAILTPLASYSLILFIHVRYDVELYGMEKPTIVILELILAYAFLNLTRKVFK
jgi:hypothetical protein